MKRYEFEQQHGELGQMRLESDGEWIRYSDHVEAMKRIAGDGVAPSFDCSLASVDAHDPQSFIDGAKWAQQRLAAPSASAQKPVATVRVTSKGYAMTLSTHVAYALPEGMHDLYAAPAPSASHEPVGGWAHALEEAERETLSMRYQRDAAIQRAEAAEAAQSNASPAALTDALAKIGAILGPGSNELHTLLVCIRNVKHFSDCLDAVEREFFMVPGEPDEDDPDGEPDDECLLNRWGSTVEQYIEQFRTAIPHLVAASLTSKENNNG